MGGALGNLGKVIRDANMNPEIMMALKNLPVEMMEKELGRSLNDLETDVLLRELENRGIQKQPTDQVMMEQMQKTSQLLKELLEKQNDLKKQIINSTGT